MKQIRIDFVDLDSTFYKDDNIILSILKRNYDVVVDEDNPDYIFYGDNGARHWSYKGCIKIYVAQENRMPNFRYCHYAMSFLNLKDPRNIRMPFYIHFDMKQPELFVKTANEWQSALEKKSKFCAFVVSNANLRRTQKRIRFFEKLSKYKKVDSGGRVMNNIGGPVADKRKFISDYKFMMAFENRSYPGYVTEKIVDPMVVRTMPLYWGSPDVAEDFNSKSFVNILDFKSDEEAIDYIIELDRNDDLYLEKCREPYFYDNKVSDWFKPERYEGFLRNIFDRPILDHRLDRVYCKHILFNIKKNLEPYYAGA